MNLCIVAPCVFASAQPARDSLANFIGDRAARTGIKPSLVSVSQCSNVAKARYHLGKRALLEVADVFLWIDDDSVFSTDDAERLLTSLAPDKHVVSGCYVQKKLGGAIVGGATPGGTQDLPLLEMDVVGFGFLAMRRHVLEATVEAKAFTCTPSAHRNDVEGEDESFSRWWRAVGGQLWLHTDVAIGHVGLHTFECPA